MVEEVGTSKGRRPDLRVVQAGTDKEGKSQFTNVGGIWLNAEGSKSAGVLKIGDARFVLFKNEPKK